MAESQASRTLNECVFCGRRTRMPTFVTENDSCKKAVNLIHAFKEIDANYIEQEIYFDELRKRLKVGAECYGGKSFHKPEEDLLREIQEEILDIAGWSYILWAKIERLKSSIDK